eukprot:jgi/Mesen1/8151/ME000438S07249
MAEGFPSGSDDGNIDGLESSQPQPLAKCLLGSIGSGVSGGVLGFVFGAGGGLLKKERSMKLCMAEGRASAKTFAIMSGVHATVVCLLKRLDRTSDSVNTGIAGCATGMALSLGSPPLEIAKGCVTFGLFSFVIDRMGANKAAPPAIAAMGPRRKRQTRPPGARGPQALPNVLPPFTLPSVSLPEMLSLPGLHGQPGEFMRGLQGQVKGFAEKHLQLPPSFRPRS